MEVGLYIPCFNAKHTIRQCLESVFQQTYPLKKVIIVDDGSIDTSVDIAREFPVELIRHAHNQGLASARNTAVDAMDTEFIASLDADCFAMPDWLACLMQHFHSPRIAGAGGQLLDEQPSSVFDLWRSVHMKQRWGDSEKFPSFLFGSNTVFRKKALIEVGRYNEPCRNNYEDVDISQRLKKAGYVLAYEAKARAHHLRTDTISTVFNAYWNWHASYYRKEGYYNDLNAFIFKVQDNIGLANRYLEEDIALQRHKLLYLDFLLAFHHSLRDLEHFIAPGQQPREFGLEHSMLPHWLALFDLTFFCHFDSSKARLSTFLSCENSFLQNILAMNLILGRSLKDRFSTQFQENLYKHLSLSMHISTHPLLSQKLAEMAELHPDWSVLFKKSQPHLNSSFLERIYESITRWIDTLEGGFSGSLGMIEASQKASG